MKYPSLVFILVTSITLNTVAAKEHYYKCYEYNASQFVLDETYETEDEFDIKKYKIDTLKIFYFKDRTDPNRIPLRVQIEKKGHTLSQTDFSCSDFNASVQHCGVECDGGGFYLTRDYVIKIDPAVMMFGSPDFEGIAELDIKQKTPGYIQGYEIQCPKEKFERSMTIELDNEPNGHYVCYTGNDPASYYGCMISAADCRQRDMQTFGKYSTLSMTKHALKKCQTVKPNPNSVDNPNGTYVCYDYKNTQGNYIGCMRSTKTCKVIGKQHFGHYPDKKESGKAMMRCMTSLLQLR